MDHERLSVTRKKINNIKVRPIREIEVSKHKVLGKELFPEPYANIYLVARKKSGKSVTVFNILKKCANKNTVVIFFVSTLFKDSSYKHIIKWLKDHKIPYIAETSFKKVDPNTNREYDQFDQLVKYLKSSNTDNEWLDLLADSDSEDDSEYDSDREQDSQKTISTKQLKQKYKNKQMSDSEDDLSDYEEQLPIRKSTILAPEIILVCDDISEELHDATALKALLKENRHIKSKVIISTQGAKDIQPTSIGQQDYILAYPKIPKDHLEHLHKFAKVDIPFNLFQAIYKDATKPDKPGTKSHHFLLIDTVTNCFRRDFNYQYELPEDQDD